MAVVRVNSAGANQSFAREKSAQEQTASETEFQAIRSFEIRDGRYIVRFARTREEVDDALRLRFEVFNLELREGLEASFLTERDEDEFDAGCDHLLVIERESKAVVGTYRLQTLKMAGSANGFYCAGEFDLEELPAEVLLQSLEIGRACIAREHRNTRVLFLLWKGLAAYLDIKKKRYLFGCCSLTSQSCADGARAERVLKNENHFHETLRVAVRDEYICQPESDFDLSSEETESFELPKLFHTYLRFGAKACSAPAIDRRFKTIDFFVLFDIETIDEKYRQMFFG